MGGRGKRRRCWCVVFGISLPVRIGNSAVVVGRIQLVCVTSMQKCEGLTRGQFFTRSLEELTQHTHNPKNAC